MEQMFSTRTNELVGSAAITLDEERPSRGNQVRQSSTLSTYRTYLDVMEKNLDLSIEGVDPRLAEIPALVRQVSRPDKIVSYYDNRARVIDDIVDDVVQRPEFLMELLDEISELTISATSVSGVELKRTSPGAVLTLTNLAEIYYISSMKLVGHGSYVLSVDKDGNIIRKNLPSDIKGAKLGEQFYNITYNSVITHHFDPVGLSQIVQDGEPWSDFTQEDSYPYIPNGLEIGSHLLKFARDNKESVRPWPHEIVIGNDPIYSITVLDNGDEGLLYKVKHRDGSIIAGGIVFDGNDSFIFQSDAPGKQAKWNSNPVNTESIVALVAAITRDMFVVETVPKFYDERRSTKPGGGRRRKKENRYIWIPKKRINYVGAPGTVGEHIYATAPYDIKPHHHKVIGHRRKGVKNPNPKLVEMGRRAGLNMEPGYTYIKPYEYDNLGGSGERRLYKSRSALETLFG
jgi:hypothetical protein